MNNRFLKRALFGAALIATSLLGGCYVAPYPYAPRYAYGPPVVYGSYYHPYHYYYR